MMRSKKKTLIDNSTLLPFVAIIGIVIVIAFVSNYEPKRSYNWNEIRTEIKDSIEVAEIRTITSGFGGMGISTIREVNRRRWIMKNATVSELMKLTEYPNGNVKAIAYEGLLRKEEFTNKTELVLRAIKDTLYPVYYQSGCIVTRREIGEYIIQDILMIDERIHTLPPEMSNEFGITENDKQKILLEYKKLSKFEL